MEKLISMTDFVLEQRLSSEKINEYSIYQIQKHINSYYDKIYAYANFLKRPLTLGMFIPCDFDGNVLEDIVLMPSDERIQYLEAKDHVLFKGFENRENTTYADPRKELFFIIEDRFIIFSNDFTIGDVVCISPELTPTALKQIGL